MIHMLLVHLQYKSSDMVTIALRTGTFVTHICTTLMMGKTNMTRKLILLQVEVLLMTNYSVQLGFCARVADEVDTRVWRLF